MTPTSDFRASPILMRSRSAEGVAEPGVIPPGNGVCNPPNACKVVSKDLVTVSKGEEINRIRMLAIRMVSGDTNSRLLPNSGMAN